MYLSGLSFSLKPPKWLRDLGAQVVSQTHVSIPTPAGAVTVDLSDPTAVDQLKRTLLGTRVSFGPPAPSALDRLAAGIGGAPDWGTLALVGGLGLAGWFMLTRLRPFGTKRGR